MGNHLAHQRNGEVKNSLEEFKLHLAKIVHVNNTFNFVYNFRLTGFFIAVNPQINIIKQSH